MQRLVNKYITLFLQFYYKKKLPSYTGTKFISPEPSYISQFIGIYPSSITLETPLTNRQHIKKFGAKDSQEFTFWSWRDCGIVCVKMILDTKGKAKNKSIMDLTREGIQLGGYILYENDTFVDRGWFHHSLAALLKQYGISAETKKWQTIESVAKEILANKLVILSVLVPGRKSIQEDGSFQPKKNATFGGHLLLAVGVKMKGKKVEGIYVHDPRGLEKYQKRAYILTPTFDNIFTNRIIVAS